MFLPLGCPSLSLGKQQWGRNPLDPAWGTGNANPQDLKALSTVLELNQSYDVMLLNSQGFFTLPPYL